MNKKPETLFTLPPGVDCRKTSLRSGRIAYVFEDARLGELGRLVVLPHQGQSQWLCEVSGDPDDPLTKKRRDILTPIVRTFLKTKQGHQVSKKLNSEDS